MENVDSMLTGLRPNPEPATLGGGAASQVEKEDPKPEGNTVASDAQGAASSVEAEASEQSTEGQEDGKKVDEYGNEYEEKTSISIEEHRKILEEQKRAANERMNQEIRRRLEKNKGDELSDPYVTQQAQPQGEQSQQDIDWEKELDNYIGEAVNRTLTTREQKAKEQEIQRKAQEEMSKFEQKFNSGVERYDDFVQALESAPLKPSMLIATKSMKDPAAFWYHASKTKNEDLKRIAALENPVDQAVELGRLESSMRKGNSATQASKPPASVSGDTGSYKLQKGVDELIMEDAKRRFKSKT
jgi:hypothetical protein